MKKIIGWLLLIIVGFVCLSILAGATELVFKIPFWHAMLSILGLIGVVILVGAVIIIAMYLISKD